MIASLPPFSEVPELYVCLSMLVSVASLAVWNFGFCKPNKPIFEREDDEE